MTQNPEQASKPNEKNIVATRNTSAHCDIHACLKDIGNTWLKKGEGKKAKLFVTHC